MSWVSSRTSQESFDTSHQFSRVKRFRYIGVGTEFQADHFVANLVACRQQEDWGGQSGQTHGVADVQPTQMGKHDVENNQIKTQTGRLV